jgi:hypothetical protein
MMTLDYVFTKCTGHDTQYWYERGELDWFDKYANPREDSRKGVLTANWNKFPRPDDHGFNWTRQGKKFGHILEAMGYNLEWSDQTSRCDHCNGCITDGPDYYGDSAHYAFLVECNVLCEHCIRANFAEEYLEGLENNPRIGMFINGIDPAEYGYEELESNFQNGFHPGQTDDPKKIFARLKGKYSRLLFVIDELGQFDVHFSVWFKREGVER